MLTSVPNLKITLDTPQIERIPLHQLEGWKLNEDLVLSHDKDRFFEIIGQTNIDTSKNIIIYDQNEVGYLFLACLAAAKEPFEQKFFCNLKFEPGNCPFYQLSPTIQKTFSNINAAHGGKRFNLDSIRKYKEKIAYSLLHSEQSNSFLHKKNLNELAFVNDSFLIYAENQDNLIQYTLRELLTLALMDNCIHIDLRSCITPHLINFFHYLYSIPKNESKYKILNTLVAKLSFHAIHHQSTWRYRPIRHFATYDGIVIKNETSPYIKQEIIGLSIKCGGREVSSWHQPLLVYPDQHFILLFTQKSDRLMILASITIGPGSRNEPELSPSFSTTQTYNELKSLFINASEVHSSLQSEEGGRFYHRQNKHTLIEVESEELPEAIDSLNSLIWIDSRELEQMIYSTHLCSIELRSSLFVLFAYLINQK